MKESIGPKEPIGYQADTFYVGMWYMTFRGPEREWSDGETLVTTGDVLLNAWRDPKDSDRWILKGRLEIHSPLPRVVEGSKKWFEEDFQAMDDETGMEKSMEHGNIRMQLIAGTDAVVSIQHAGFQPLLCYGGEIPDKYDEDELEPWFTYVVREQVDKPLE